MKKGSLELSVNAIVIVVLAMTLLGLGLAFIRGQMKNISDTGNVVVGQIREQILDDLRRSDKKLSMPQTDFEMHIGSSKTIAFGIKNMEDHTLHFKIKVIDLNENADDCTNGNPDHEHVSRNRNAEVPKECAAFRWDSSEQTLKPSEANVYPIKLFAPKIASTYMYKIFIIDTSTGEEYTSKTFYVTTS